MTSAMTRGHAALATVVRYGLTVSAKARARAARAVVVGFIVTVTMTATWADQGSSHARRATPPGHSARAPRSAEGQQATPLARPPAANAGRGPAARSSASSSTPSSSVPGSPSPSRTIGPADSAMWTGTSAVALTFDDGPDPFYTPQILDLLKAHGVKATFCLVGFRARDNPAVVRRIAAEGHTLCSHSWQHLFDLGTRTPEYIKWDLRSTNEAIRTAVPGARIEYFRSPGGNFTPFVVDFAKQLGMKSIYWHVDPRDWDKAAWGSGGSMTNHIVSVVQAQTRPGSIILSHDLNKPDTIVAYRTLLPWLEQRFTLAELPTALPTTLGPRST